MPCRKKPKSRVVSFGMSKGTAEKTAKKVTKGTRRVAMIVKAKKPKKFLVVVG